MNLPNLARVGVSAMFLAAPVGTILSATQTAYAQARSIDLEYLPEELTRSDQNLRQLQEEQPQLFQQILKDINKDTNARDPTSVEALAAASPALDDLNRRSPEALLGLFLLLKGAAKPDGKGAPR
jgi:hypothetical protein